MNSVKDSFSLPVLGSVSDLDELGPCEQLHDETGGDDWRDAQLHQGASGGRPVSEW